MTVGRLQKQPATIASRDRDLAAWVTLCAVLLWAAMAVPFLCGRLYAYDDLGAFHLPLRVFYATCLARGEAFDWLPHLFGGFYLTGEGQVGTYHPWHWLLYRTLEPSTAFCLELLATYPFMYVGMFLWLRRFLRRRGPAAWGALLFTFGSFCLLHFMHMNAIAIVAHIGWLLWAIDIALRDDSARKRWTAEMAIVLLTASQLLLGYPQYVWFSLLAEAALIIGVCWTSVSRALLGRIATTRHVTAIRLSKVAAAKLLALMIGSVQLFATFEQLQLSVRDHIDPAFCSMNSLHPLNVAQLVAPYLFSDRVIGRNTQELGMYLGAVPLVVIAWWIFGAKRSARCSRLGVFMLLSATVALVLALGRYGSLYAWQAYLPLVGGFRCPGRYLALFQLAMVVLASVAFSDLFRRSRLRSRPNRRELLALATPAFASVLVVPLFVYVRPSEMTSSRWLLLAGPVLLGSSTILVFLVLRGVSAAVPCLVIFTAADLGAYGLSYAVFRENLTPEQYVATVPEVPATIDDRVAYDLTDVGQPISPIGNRLLLAGHRRIDGYAGLPPARRSNLRDVDFLRLAGVRWVRRTKVTSAIEGLTPHGEDWLAVPDPLPRIRIDPLDVPIAETVAHPIAYRPSDPRVQPSTPPFNAAANNAQIVFERPGRIVVRVECQRPSQLVVAETYHPGWQAKVAGEPLRVDRADGDFLGCPVPPGTHEVVWQFDPWSLRWGKQLSLLGLCTTAVIFAARASRMRRRA